MTTGKTFSYVDPYDFQMDITPSPFRDADVQIVIRSRDSGDSGPAASVDLPVEDLPRVVGELYRAAGKDAPIILDRPAGDPYGTLALFGLAVTGPRGGRLFRIDTVGDAVTGFAGLRMIAAALAAVADTSPPPRTAVDELADIIASAPLDAERIAEAVLAAGYRRGDEE